MSPAKVLFIAICTFLAPCFVVLAIHHEELVDAMHIEASEASGKLLFFTAPSR